MGSLGGLMVKALTLNVRDLSLILGHSCFLADKDKLIPDEPPNINWLISFGIAY